MAKGWHQKQKDKEIKLILTWFKPRKCWKKYRDGKTKYFHHPNSAAGYEAAVAEYHAWLQEERDNRPLVAEYLHHIALLEKFCEWYERFGTPDSEERFDEDGMRDEIFLLRDRLQDALTELEELPSIIDLLPTGETQKQLLYYLSFVLDFAQPAHFGSVYWQPTY